MDSLSEEWDYCSCGRTHLYEEEGNDTPYTRDRANITRQLDYMAPGLGRTTMALMDIIDYACTGHEYGCTVRMENRGPLATTILSMLPDLKWEEGICMECVRSGEDHCLH
jgi:hypothetical protein